MSTSFITAKALTESLQSSSLDDAWRDMLDGWEQGPVDTKADLLVWIRHQRDEFLQAIRIIDDPEDLQQSAVIRYIELKCHWILLNNQVNYTMVHTGSPPEEQMYRAGLAANLLGALEEHIRSEHVDAIATFLSEPATQLPETGDSEEDSKKKRLI